MSGPRLLSQTIPKIAGKVFSRKYIMLGRLMTQWAEIVGDDLALKTAPVKLRTMKSKKTGKRTASLDIAAATADATVLHYRKDLILERINLLFGEGLITSIRFVPKALNDSGPAKPIRKKALTIQEKKYLSSLVEDIDDADIKEKLERLGKAILQDRAS